MINFNLAMIPLFSELGADGLAVIANAMRPSEVPPGQVIVQENQPGDTLYILTRGRVEVYKSIDQPEPLRLNELGPGEYFGEMSLIEPGALRTASVRAMTPVGLLELCLEDFQEMLRAHPELGLKFLRVLSERLRRANEATIFELKEKNQQLAQAYQELKAAQEQKIRMELLERELSVAHQVQQDILPQSLPRLPGFDFGAVMDPARAVGGDLYDFTPLNDNRLGVVVADVSDKGLPAAIFMAMVRSLLRAEAHICRSPRQVLQKVNHLLLEINAAPRVFVTALYGILDGASGEFHYARAGHDLPVLQTTAGTMTMPPAAAGQPLCLFPKPALDEQVVQLEPGARLLIYSDGVTDAMDPQGSPFGMEGIQAALDASRGMSAQAAVTALRQAAQQHQRGQPQFDDFTAVLIQAV
jgi:serine phosphatase RsbU (regulator of sigma subunit)